MDLKTKFKVFGVLSRMSDRIMKHQQENGFDTIFDFLNEDIADVKKCVCGGETSHEISGLHLQNVSVSTDINTQVDLLTATLDELMHTFDSDEDKMDFILDICNTYKKKVIEYSR